MNLSYILVAGAAIISIVYGQCLPAEIEWDTVPNQNIPVNLTYVINVGNADITFTISVERFDGTFSNDPLGSDLDWENVTGSYLLHIGTEASQYLVEDGADITVGACQGKEFEVTVGLFDLLSQYGVDITNQSVQVPVNYGFTIEDPAVPGTYLSQYFQQEYVVEIGLPDSGVYTADSNIEVISSEVTVVPGRYSSSIASTVFLVTYYHPAFWNDISAWDVTTTADLETSACTNTVTICGTGEEDFCQTTCKIQKSGYSCNNGIVVIGEQTFTSDITAVNSPQLSQTFQFNTVLPAYQIDCSSGDVILDLVPQLIINTQGELEVGDTLEFAVNITTSTDILRLQILKVWIYSQNFTDAIWTVFDRDTGLSNLSESAQIGETTGSFNLPAIPGNFATVSVEFQCFFLTDFDLGGGRRRRFLLQADNEFSQDVNSSAVVPLAKTPKEEESKAFTFPLLLASLVSVIATVIIFV